MAKSEVKAPAGFDVNLGRLDSAGWVAREPGNQVTGTILGRFEFGAVQKTTGRKQAYYQLRLLTPCMVYPNRDKDDESGGIDEETGELPPAVEMQGGTVVNLSETTALQDLQKAMELIERGAEVDVWTGYVKKEPNRSGQGNHWVHFGPKLRITKEPRPAHPI